jgi:hypothetical protein
MKLGASPSGVDAAGLSKMMGSKDDGIEAGADATAAMLTMA